MASPPATATQRELFHRYRRFAESIARSCRARLPRSFLLEDIRAAALAGLWDAVLKYSELPNSEFRTLAGMRIRGEIFDECRKHDWLPRHAREGFAGGFRQIHVDAIKRGLESFGEYSTTPDHEAGLDERRRLKMLEEAVGRLPDKKRYVMRALLAGREQTLIAKQLGVTGARVSQIASEAVRQLKEELG